ERRPAQTARPDRTAGVVRAGRARRGRAAAPRAAPGLEGRGL
ncbi:MAG: hypothetical protein AVDCRST_MAG64-22, partial [uncultured Phycisphaerae bacterium]